MPNSLEVTVCRSNDSDFPKIIRTFNEQKINSYKFTDLAEDISKQKTFFQYNPKEMRFRDPNNRQHLLGNYEKVITYANPPDAAGTRKLRIEMILPNTEDKGIFDKQMKREQKMRHHSECTIF